MFINIPKFNVQLFSLSYNENEIIFPKHILNFLNSFIRLLIIQSTPKTLSNLLYIYIFFLNFGHLSICLIIKNSGCYNSIHLLGILSPKFAMSNKSKE